MPGSRRATLTLSINRFHDLLHKIRQALARELEEAVIDGEVEINRAFVKPTNGGDNRRGRRLVLYQNGRRRLVLPLREREAARRRSCSRGGRRHVDDPRGFTVAVPNAVRVQQRSLSARISYTATEKRLGMQIPSQFGPDLSFGNALRLKEWARNYCWDMDPKDALSSRERVVRRVMDLGVLRDVVSLERMFPREDIVMALKNAPPGALRPRSWAFWHYRLGLVSPGEDAPPEPTRAFA